MYKGQPVAQLQEAYFTEGIMKGYVFKTAEELGEKDDKGVTDLIGFFIPRIQTLTTGNAGPTEEDVTIKKDIYANSSKTLPALPGSVKKINYIKVQYNGRSNFSQPIIALGETAHIFFVDGDYKKPRYTDSCNNEVKRKTDHVEFFVYGKEDVDEDPGDKYFIALSSRDKFIHIHTSMENGEAHVYDVKINTEESTIKIWDDMANECGIETENKRIYAINESLSQVELIDTNINAKCDAKITIECEDYELHATNSVVITADTKYELVSTKIDMTGDSTIDTHTATMTNEVSSLYKTKCPTSLFSDMLGASSIGISPSSLSPPSIQLWNSAGMTITQGPKDVTANAQMVVTAINSLIPFTKIPPIALSILSSILPQIPNTQVKQ